MREAALQTDLRLLNAAHPTRWGNLGCWEEGASYPAACRALARRLGQAAGLAPGVCVLDCGVGAGEQLREWVEGFGVERVVARELLAEHVVAARRIADDLGGVEVTRGSATELGDLSAGSFEVVLALDCAYHFDPRARFFAEARRVARPSARLTLTDVVLEGRPGRGLGRLAELCGVPAGNLSDRAGYEAELARAGWRVARWEPLDREVLGGFAAFARRHLPRAVLARPLGGWPKVLATALGCRWALLSRRLHYVLIVAEPA